VIYTFPDGSTVDTARQCSFEERNFLQKMMIYHHLKVGQEEFRARWRSQDSPVWRGPDTLSNPSPAVRILLDLERKLARGE